MSYIKKWYKIIIFSVISVVLLSLIFSIWPSFTDTMLVYMVLYGYVILFIISFLAAFIVPIPSGSVLMTASAFASIGYFDIRIIFIIAILGNILGDISSFYIAHKYGKNILNRIGFKNILSSATFTSIEEKFKKNPGFIIFISRFEVISTLSVNILSGLGNISFKKFINHEILGTFFQITIYVLIGYFFGDGWQAVDTLLGKWIIFGLLAIVLILISFSKRILNKIFKKYVL